MFPNRVYYHLYLICLLINLNSDRLLHLLQYVEDKRTTSLFVLDIAILSARQNFDKRQAIRNTWFQEAFLANKLAARYGWSFKVNVHFVLGKSHCLVHPINREDIYSCVSKSELNLSQNKSDLNVLFELSSNHFSSSYVHRLVHKGFSFKTFTPITLQKVGVLSSLLNQVRKVSVVLLNAFTKEKIFSTIVDKEEKHFSQEGIFDYVAFQVDLDSESTFLIQVETERDIYINYPLQSSLGSWESILKILRSYHGPYDYDSKAFSNEDLFCLNFQFDIKDSIRNHSRFNQVWFVKQQNIDNQLAKEKKLHQDIIYVPMVDVYRSLPQKLLLYFASALKRDTSFTHLLKTDDDCYVNIWLVIEMLLRNYQTKLTWFGNFRKKWAVNYYGKWADDSYTSPVYPHFACGSGYILTRDLVEWLNLNSNYLHLYQGEDVSMGIWLSAVQPKIIQDKRWLCEEATHTDGQNFLSAPQLTSEAMIRRFSSRKDENNWVIRRNGH